MRLEERDTSSATEPIPSGEPPRSRKGALTLLLVAILGVTALFAFGLRRNPSLIRSALVGNRAPAFTLRTIDGKQIISLADLRGQVVVVNFWASWCAACRQEHPNLLAAWNRYRDQGVVIVGIVFEDSPGAAMAYMRELGGDWPTVTDPGGRTALAYGIYGIPETFFIGMDGRIAFKQVGYSSYDVLVNNIQQLLSSAGGSTP
jgi:cytochrome c biogenesis protein CcmG/thiol:disulfide interchange protein DsbE